ncbi:SMODS domain-containing nucleotidyltransferase [Ornithobacterium rhinotracheale]|uniref:SMODS domain-containing nucleotidyltransferase n=1 Tax=Ornithobacterium rhinotracheale TaxID=28251 RepID=UPI0038733093
MNVSENFKAFIDNLKIPENKAEIISSRYGRITKTLNKKFRNTESEISNRLQVGSYGRFTGIKSIVKRNDYEKIGIKFTELYMNYISYI